MSAVQRFYRSSQLPDLTGYTIGHIYNLMRKGAFPKPVKVGEWRSAWLESDIAAWQQARIEASKYPE